MLLLDWRLRFRLWRDLPVPTRAAFQQLMLLVPQAQILSSSPCLDESMPLPPAPTFQFDVPVVSHRTMAFFLEQLAVSSSDPSILRFMRVPDESAFLSHA